MIETPRYDEAAAEATSQSERVIRRDVTRGETLGAAALIKIARTSLDKGDELDDLQDGLAPRSWHALTRCAPAMISNGRLVDDQKSLSSAFNALILHAYGGLDGLDGFLPLLRTRWNIARSRAGWLRG